MVDRSYLWGRPHPRSPTLREGRRGYIVRSRPTSTSRLPDIERLGGVCIGSSAVEATVFDLHERNGSDKPTITR